MLTKIDRKVMLRVMSTTFAMNKKKKTEQHFVSPYNFRSFQNFTNVRIFVIFFKTVQFFCENLFL